MSACEATRNTICFCGLDFWNSSVGELLSQLRQRGGYVVVPSAPSFAMMHDDADFERAMVSADFALIDSGYMAIVMAALLRRRVRRISGLKLLQHLLVYDKAGWGRDAKILWVSPSPEETNRIRHYLQESDFDLNQQAFYQAPFYASAKTYHDTSLADLIRSQAPDIVVLGIAGGKQEKLAYELSSTFAVRAPILCTGAAMAFLTGGQAKIPTWADRCYLGWLCRILKDPRKFLPRYLHATWALPVAIVNRSRGG